MVELVEAIARALVDNPDEVSVSETQDGTSKVVELRVASGDMEMIYMKFLYGENPLM